MDNCDGWSSLQINLKKMVHVLYSDIDPSTSMDFLQPVKVEEEHKNEDLVAQKSSTLDFGQSTWESKPNLGNFDNSILFEFKLEPEELIIKDEPVVEENGSHELLDCSTNPSILSIGHCRDNTAELIRKDESVEIIKHNTNLPTFSIRDRIANTEIKVDPMICTIEELDNIRSCFVKVIRIPRHVFTSKMIEYLKLRGHVEVTNDDYMTQESFVHLKGHKQIHASENPFKCSKCHKCFKCRQYLRRHMVIHDGKRPFNCQECNKNFTLKQDLKRHMLIHTSEKPFKCQECSRTFTSKNSLKQHELIHNKPINCQECHKSFAHKRYFKQHMLIHSGQSSFKCQECNKNFVTTAVLKQHMFIHTGEKPFKCQQCNKNFARNGQLQQHMLNHSGEKPFKCQECDRGFTTKNNLKQHKLIHNKPFNCQECNKNFTTKAILQHHMDLYRREAFQVPIV